MVVVKLLVDENLAARLVRDVAGTYPDSAHLETLHLMGAADELVWQRAGQAGYVLVTKDEDFHRMSVVYGPPPKVVWIRLGNCATADVARLLCSEVEQVRGFVADPETSFLSLGKA